MVKAFIGGKLWRIVKGGGALFKAKLHIIEKN
jgi:hypothetical protein